MAEKVGEIYYDVDLDTAQMIAANQKARQELDNLGNQAKGAAAGVKTLETQMKTSAAAVNQATKSGGAFRSQFQQAGYQIQDFIVQVQGGQSALVAFSQQGSQLAGAFGPGGAIVGAVIALGSVIAGTLITALNGGKNAMDALKDAADEMDKVITISQNGVAALSDKYANLARVNAQVATLMRNQALLEYNQAIAKIPGAISDATDAFVSFGDKVSGAFTGGIPSVNNFSRAMSDLNITTNNFSDVIKQVPARLGGVDPALSAINNTVTALSSRLGISEQAAFELAKQLSDLSKNPSPQALQDLANKLQGMTSSSKDGQAAITALLGPIVALSREAANAAYNVSLLKNNTDNLTEGQKNLVKQSERNLALSKLQGEARARLAAQYAAEDAGFTKDDPHTKQMQEDAAATYSNLEASQKLKSEQKKSASQAESIAQKLANLKQQADLSADSTNSLSREQAILNAQISLGKGATQQQIQLAGQYAAKKWDTANAIKAQAAAEKLLPETRENASYKQDLEDLKTALAAKKITQQQADATAEQLEKQHQANIAKIRADQVVSPGQEAVGAVDPVQQLANQNAQKLALIQQFEQQRLITEQQGLSLRNAANTEYEQQRIAAQWQIYKAQNQSNELLGTAIESLGGGATNAITGLLNGTQSLSEAFANLGTAVLNGLVSSLVEMGVRWVESAVMGQAAQQSAIAANQATAAAALATSTATGAASAAALLAAFSPAAMAASIATSGGAAAAGLAGYSTAMTAAQTMSLAGMREHGGPVNANSMYRVGEGGKPEIFKASNGSQYMIPGDNGRVLSNRDIGGDGYSGGMIQQINNFTFNNASGDQQETVTAFAKIAYEQSLRAIKDQQRPGGMLTQRK